MKEVANLGAETPEELELIRSVGLRIKMLRTRLNLNHAELEARTGMKKAYLFELERGVTNVTLRTLCRIATGLQVTVSDLIPTAAQLKVDPLTIDSLLEVTAALLKSLEERKFASDQAHRRQTESVRHLQRLLGTLGQEGASVSESNRPNAAQE